MHEHVLPNLNNRHESDLRVASSERRTKWVILLTASMMLAELAVGQWTGSMALLADGFHMGTHVGALGLAAAAYWFARTRAGHRLFSFGTGKVYALAGYTSAVCLALVALLMGLESLARLHRPVAIHFREALPVAVLGLIINLMSAALLGHNHDHDDDHDHDSDRPAHHHDHNLRAAYLHVLADALTSVLAIVALVCGRYWGWSVLDPLMGVVGAVVILKWAWGLCQGAALQLLDACPSHEDEERLRASLETIDDVRVADLHLWEVGPGLRSCIVSLFTSRPRETDFYREHARSMLDLSHITVEVHRCEHHQEPA
jgi:cation diffusion facilitator family transporter